MKRVIVLLGSALVVLAGCSDSNIADVGVAKAANGEQTIHMSLAGSNFITSDEDGVPTPLDGRPLVAIQNGIVQGGGAALFTSNAALDAIPMNPAEFPPDCQAAGLAGSTLTVSFVLMYNDGSLLSLTTGPGAYFCTDGTVFTVAGEGAVTGGEKRFAGATGTFSATAESTPPRVLAELDIDLD
jgi:hypothetical protein